jgi:predicted RND superfamily exporter protein
MGLSERVQDMLANTMRWSAQRAWAVISVVLLLSLGSGVILLMVEPNVETDIQSGYFATHDDQANMFRELRDKVAGVNSEIVYFELKDDVNLGDQAEEGVKSMTSLAAQEELFSFVKQRFIERTADMGINGGDGVDKVISHTSLPYFEKLIYSQYPNGCFCLAPTQQEHESAQNLLDQADSTGAVALYHSDDLKAAVMFIIYEPDTSDISKKETGGLINEIIGEYRDLEDSPDGLKTYDIWKDDYFDSWGVQSWIYVIDEQVAVESVAFILTVFAFLTVTLLFLFRNVKRAAIGVFTVAIILLWTLAGMTIGGVSVGFVSMAMFPLLLGVGVDYVIHIINEFGTERANVGSSDEAFDLIGRRGAVALFISTLTTISGFLVMITSTSPMIVEIGTATIMGMIAIFTLSMTWIPALLHLSVRNEAKEVMRESKLVGNYAAAIGKHKAITIAVLLVVTGGFAYFIPKTEYVVGTVEINLPQREIFTGDDSPEHRSHMLDMYQRFQIKIKSTGQETIITKALEPGGLATREAVQDMIRIHKALQAEPFVQESGGAVNSVPFILNLYALLEDGLQTAVPGILNGALQGGVLVPCDPQLPQCFAGIDPDYDQDFGLIQDWDTPRIKAAIADMLTREEWTPLLLTFMDETASIAWALTFVNIEINQDATDKANDALSHALEVANPTDTKNNYFGTLTGVAKYNDYTNKWLTISSIVSLVVVALLVLLFSRSLRAVAATITPMIITFIWWLGALPTAAVDIDLAFIFMIPIAFITSLGSDYAVHLTWNLEKQGNPKYVFKTVGKAVMYSGFTTLVSFYIFTRGAIRGSYEMFEAAVIAIAIMTVVSLTTIPLFYFKKGDSETSED